MSVHFRLRNRETPEGEIECPVDGTVNPDETCLTCAYSDKCPNFEAWLAEEMGFCPECLCSQCSENTKGDDKMSKEMPLALKILTLPIFIFIWGIGWVMSRKGE